MGPTRATDHPMTARRLADRLRHLERTCSALWFAEPLVDQRSRSRLLRQLAEIERWVTGAALRVEIDPDSGRQIEQRLTRYERRVEDLAAAWRGTNAELVERATA